MSAIHLEQGDALLIVYMQDDLLPGGAQAIPEGHQVTAPVNQLIGLFSSRGLPVFASLACQPGCAGAAFAPEMALPDNATRIIRDAAGAHAGSVFAGTSLARQLRKHGIGRLVVCGLALDYGVLDTVTDALEEGFDTVVVPEAMRAVEANPGDARRALDRMVARGAVAVRLGERGMTALSVA